MSLIGVIGGGQLGRMLIDHGINRIGEGASIRVRVMNHKTLECSVAAAAFDNVEIVVGDYQSETDLIAFAQGCDVITWEIEHVNVDALQRLEDAGQRFVPSVATLRTIQDKATQKQFLRSNGFDVVDFVLSSNPLVDFWNTPRQELVQTYSHDPVVYKSRRSGFDGRGVWIVQPEGHRSFEDVQPFGQPNGHLGEQPTEEHRTNTAADAFIIERHIPPQTKMEISVIVGVNHDGTTSIVYDPVLMTFHKEANIIDSVSLLENHHPQLQHFRDVATRACATFKSAGLFAVEFFYVYEPGCEGGRLFINEIAPRVHNSGHHTIETYNASQFETLARILLQMPLIQPQLHATIGGFVMRNLYVNDDNCETRCKLVNHMIIPDAIRGPFAHDYQKGVAKKWRKMGHVTCTGETQSEATAKMQWCKLGNVVEFIRDEAAAPPPRIGIVMGSESDWPVMVEACQVLRFLNVPYEVTVVSAHRTPQRLVTYAATATERGIRVIIAGAGGAAHLPGMIASFVDATVPVIGIPVKTATLNGIDSLYSIVQMPPGVPVACMAINGAKNAAILAVQILAVADSDLRVRLTEYRSHLEDAVLRMTSFRNVSVPE